MKSFLKLCTLALMMSVAFSAYADDDDLAADAVESEQMIIDSTADAAAAEDAKELAKNAEEEAREAEAKAKNEKHQAQLQEKVAKREMNKAEHEHMKAQEKIKKWRTEHAIWEKRRLKSEDQIAKAKARQQIAIEQTAAAQQAVADAKEAAEQAIRSRDEAQRIAEQAEEEVRRMNRELKKAKMEEARARQPIGPRRQNAATAKAGRTPSANWTQLPRDCNLREQASSGSTSLGPVLRGAKLQAKMHGQRWYKVSTEDGKAGFMAAFCFK